MEIFVHKKPVATKCLRLWLGGLMTVSYIMVIVFILWNQSQKEEDDILERVQLPSGAETFHRDMPVRKLPNKVRSDYHIENYQDRKSADRGDINKIDDEYDDKNYKLLPQSTSTNETDLRIVIYPNENKTHFAAFGFTTPRGDDYFYAFNAPLAVRAWRRIGYECIVFIIGDINEWMSKDILKHIYTELLALHPSIIFVKPKRDNEILMSQACRLFTANYFQWKNPKQTFIVTTDVDLWPLNAALFDIPLDKKVMSLNSDCCGTFDHGGQLYKLLPLGNIVTDVTTWKEIINVHGFFPRTAPEIIDYFFRDFGPLALERTRKDEYVGWYMDQRIMSMRLTQWMAKNGGNNVRFVPRDVGRDRIDANYWMPYSLHGKSDVHILPGAQKPGTWEKIRPIIKLMYSQDEEYEIVEYREKFMRLYIRNRKYTW